MTYGILDVNDIACIHVSRVFSNRSYEYLLTMPLGVYRNEYWRNGLLDPTQRLRRGGGEGQASERMAQTARDASFSLVPIG